jgi:DNA-binding HxlR family transcriptional regulator
MLDRVPATDHKRDWMVRRAFDIFADPWTYLVLREAFFGVRRFDDIRRNIEISRKTLTDRLQELVDAGLLHKVPYQSNPVRFDYRLTAAGIDFYPAIIALMMWGDRWRSGPVKPLTLLDRVTNALLQPRVVCRHCRTELRLADIAFAHGEDAAPDASGGAGGQRRSSVSTNYTRGRPCSVASTLVVIGDRWSLSVVWQSFLGARRFEEFIDGIGIARSILTDRLDRLLNAGVLRKVEYQCRPQRYEYQLTDIGLDLVPAILMMMDWSKRWGVADDARWPVSLTHTPCGQPVELLLLDAVSGAEITALSTTYKTNYGLVPPLVGQGRMAQPDQRVWAASG